MKIQVLKTKGKWRWRLVAGNNKILAHSEAYNRKGDARKTVDSVQRLLPSAAVEVFD